MGDKSKIEWTDATWNPVRGCTIVSEGCRNCYAMKQAHRFSGPGQPYDGLTRMTAHGPVWTGEIMEVEEHLEDPIRWQRPRMVFVNSMSDLFHGNVSDQYIARVFAIMGRARRHTFQLLTKRGKRMRELLADSLFHGMVYGLWLDSKESKGREFVWPLPNVWAGVSVESEDVLSDRVGELVATPLAVRMISAEPLLGPLDLLPYFEFPEETADRTYPGIGWVIVGGESGPGARPMEVSWARGIRDQCATAGVPFFFKQWGAWRDGERLGKHDAGRVLDGVTWNQFPENV